MARTRLRLLTLLWALCIMTGAMIRGYSVGANLQTTGVEHIATHLGIFAVLGFLLMLSYNTTSARMLAVLAGIVLGLGTEYYEHLVFQSSMEYADVLVDGFGVLAGATARFVIKPSK
jgi:hypothetical protein